MRKLLIILGALVIVGGGAGVAYASIPGPGGVISGCYKTSNPGQGALIVIDSSATCPSGTTALNWNQTGPQGPAGPTGPAGPQATAQDVTSQVTYTVPPSGWTSLTERPIINCPSGTLAINGGVQSEQPATPDPGQSVTNPGSALEAFDAASAGNALPQPVNSGASWQLLATIGPAFEAPNGGGQPTQIAVTVTYFAICE